MIADRALALIQEACETAEDQQGGGDTHNALATLALAMGQLADMLAPRQETVHTDPDVLFGPPFGVWRAIAPDIEIRVFSHEVPGTFHIRRVGRMPLPYPHTILVLTNGNTIRTTSNVPADIAGMINAGTQKIYACTDLTDGYTHNVMVNAILDFYQVTS